MSSSRQDFIVQLRRRYLPRVPTASIEKLADSVSYYAGGIPDRMLAGRALLVIVGEYTSQYPELWPESDAIVSFADESLRWLYEVDEGPNEIGARLHAVALSLNVPGLDARGPSC